MRSLMTRHPIASFLILFYGLGWACFVPSLLGTQGFSLIPADIPPATVAEVQRLSVAAFRAIDAAGLARVDFLLSRDTGAIVLNEVNTIPGFTTISMYSKMWEASGLSYPVLIDRLVELALERHAAKQQLRTSLP